MAKKKSIMDYRHDIFDRYKSSTSIDQTYNASAAIGRLHDDCYQYFKEGSAPFRKWHTECNNLFNLLNKAPNLVHAKKNDAIDVLEEFINEFEHVERRLRQLLHHKSVPETDRQRLKNATDFWLNSAFRFAVYALLLEKRNKRGEVPYVKITTKLVFPE